MLIGRRYIRFLFVAGFVVFFHRFYLGRLLVADRLHV